jgi:hypothetical protein
MSAPSPSRSPVAGTKPVGFSYVTLLSRVVVGVLLLASAGLLWWSYCRVYLPRVKEYHELDANVVKLTIAVDDLDHQWTKPELAAIDQKFHLVQSRLFNDQPELKSWLDDFEGQFIALGLNIKTDFNASLVSSNAPAVAGRRFSAIPTTVTIDFSPTAGSEDKDTPFQRLLQFSQRITTQDKIADLTGLTVHSGTNSIDHAVLNLTFWAGAKEAK